MAIFLRHSWNIKPPRWGSPADVQYAIRKNAEKIYGIDPDGIVLCMPLFWGLSALDYSGKNNQGTNHGATYKDGSLDFDGSDDYVEVPYTAELDFGANQNFTVGAWVKTTQASILNEWVTLVSHEDNTATRQGYNLVLHDSTVSDEWYFEFFRDGGGNDRLDGATDIADGDWHFIVGIREGATIKIYEDGIFVNSAACSSASVAKNIPLSLGGMLKAGSLESWSRFNGLINEVRISNVSRTADQIALFYDCPWALYQPISRPIYSIPVWTGKILGKTNFSKIMGKAKSVIGKVMGRS